MENIRSLYNVGAIFRSADVFGVSKIYLTGYTAYPLKRNLEKIKKTALGAEKIISCQHFWQTAKLIKQLKKKKIKIIVLELTKKSQLLSQFKPKPPLALVMGNEIKGVSKGVLKLADQIIYIPMAGKKESLNVAVATSIALYDFSVKKERQEH